MPTAIKRHKLQVLKPRLTELNPFKERGIKTLKAKQEANGRTLALNGKAWRELRALVLSEQPICQQCERMGQYTAATEVDHIDNDASNNERSNLVGLCKHHHSAKTARYEHYKRTGRWLPVKGCDLNGMPLDPEHHWNKSKKSPATETHEPTGSLHAHDRS
jgi:hypothetical protein